MLAGRYRALIGSAFGCLAVIAGGSLVAQASKQAVIVQNKPGAGSLLSVMAVANSPPSDGLAMGTFSSSLIPNAIAEPARFRIDFRNFSFIGKLAADYRVCYVRTETGIHNLKELAKRNDIG